ncbi:bifunctional 5,10-methylenetetrahydrofolate dehydrogenase/5,10-methenyltetrahydrofolate cyclohydrolase [Novosphingobium sp. 9]|uniref:bifunctional 5,10-methylenetetrahydrofolate dehydrogenase/5,10-methenyltetrahydrofolate cyclohydrolase n=1 Tax=Novosphingobium sp. 9 TaxID=2025349 RepID=UPI0021B4F1F3|nr:bifunctional methylenetetrahydrofolate dehydrogenase/methenyltetrahydrofolate cyclohydrolase FolD [Novosphingobium sp. 9]
MAEILRGDVIAAEIESELRGRIAQLAGRGVTPGLAVVLVGDDPASHVYVSRKQRAAARVGIVSVEHRLPGDTAQAELLALIAALNADPAIHGILVQLPLPPQIAADEVLDAIVPAKDVDGFHPVNVGRLSTGAGSGLVPCTPLGCMILLEKVVPDFRGLDAVVIGKSNIVGKPLALLLLERECTVTVTHIRTRGLPEIARRADILVAAAGSAGLVRGDWVKPGAVVIDVGINRIAGEDGKSRIVGDVAADECGHAGVLTPVPGGVGPMTIACLLRNTVDAAVRSAG